MADVKGSKVKKFAANVVKLAKWAAAKVRKLVGWVVDLWTDVNGQADVRIIAADVCVGAEIVFVLDFVGKVATFNVLGGLFYLAIIVLVGIAAITLLKMSKDALDKK